MDSSQSSRVADLALSWWGVIVMRMCLLCVVRARLTIMLSLIVAVRKGRRDGAVETYFECAFDLSNDSAEKVIYFSFLITCVT